jgi:cytochrome P450
VSASSIRCKEFHGPSTDLQCNSFAAGQRMCIGFNFALQEIKIFMCLLVWRYRWLKEGEPEADYDPFFQLIRPINLYVRTKKREVYPSKSDSVMT